MPSISHPTEQSREARRDSRARNAFRQGLAVTAVFWILAFAIVYIQIQRPFVDGLVFVVYFVWGGTQLACVWWLLALALTLAGKPWFKGSLLMHTVVLIPFLYLLANFSPLGGSGE